MLLSVIIPALDEAGRIADTIWHAMRAPDVEVIVVDGGSADGTAEIARAAGAEVIVTPPGRASQMNAGASAAAGETLLFLHADTRLPEDYHAHIERALATPGVVAGAFRLRVDTPGNSMRIVEWLANFRSESMRMPYGDQGIFVRAELFRNAGGFPLTPIMEDYELMRQLRRRGRIAIADAEVVTSARRWERMGVLRTTLINQLVIIGYHLGVPPEKLKRLYNRDGGVRVYRI
ncbi:MAG TPA: TIGR04283 family arsenosugar biosynthesis glycosyltransferase [Nitrospirota bacterium]